MIYQAVQSVPAVCSTAAATKTSSSILDPIAKPIADVLAFFYSIVPNYAVDIIILSVVWMILISPLTLKTTRSMLAMQKLAPEMKRLQEKHRNDRQALAAAQMELYKTHNVSPFGSCLPSILPLPVFIALFRVIDGLSHTVKVQGVSCAAPKYLSHTTSMYHAIVLAGGHINSFGLDLAKSALSGHSSVGAALPYYLLLLIMMGTQYLQTAQMMNRTPAASQNSQMQMMKYLPLFFGLICIRFPAGVVLYYAMSNVCRISQQYLMYRFDPKVKTLAIKDVIEIEATAGVTDDDPPAGMFGRRKSPAGSDSPAAGKSRFSDLLGNARQQQAVQKDTRDRKAIGKGGANGATTNRGTAGGGAGAKPAGPAPNRGTAPANRGGAKRPATKAGATNSAGSTPRADRDKPAPGGKSGATAASSAGSGRTKAPASGGRSTGGSTTGNGRPNGAKPPTASATTAAKSASPKPSAAKATASEPVTAEPVAAQTSGKAPPAATGDTGGNSSSPDPTSATNGKAPVPGNGRPTPPRTGAGSGRTGAGSGRTGAASGSRNKRRGR